MNVCATKMNAGRPRQFPLDGEHFTSALQTVARLVRNFGNQLSREIVMPRTSYRISRFAIAAYAALLPVGSALASQGPGGGMGTASSLTQVTMAVLIYGASALIVGAGLVGALRRR
jgi:hypothetical protein